MCDCCLLHHHQRLEMLYLITYYYFMIRQRRRRRRQWKRWRHTDEALAKENTHTHKAAQQQTFNHIIYDFHRFHHYIMLKSGLYIFRVVFLDSKSSFSSFRIIIISNHILFPLSLFFSLSSLFSIKLYIYLLL